jgi:glycosyltransferase involved in cell wall biosynthesis
MTKVLIITDDVVDRNMGGVGMRYWEIAHALTPHCDVTLAIPNQTDLQTDLVRVVSIDLHHGEFRSLANQMDVIFTHGFVVHFQPYLRDLGIPLVMDLFNPYLLENLVMYSAGDLEKWLPSYEEYHRVQLEMLRYGDFFTCATERARDYWLGWLHAQKRLNPHNYLCDPSFRKLIDVLPSGIQEGVPEAKMPVLKGVQPGIAREDWLILWSGGVWDWLDPLTPIRAMAILAPRYPHLKLYFMGTHHPNPIVPDMPMVDRARSLSQELGVYNKSVFFGNWVPYLDRQNYLVEADLTVLAHLGHIETHFSFRTRLLDSIWAGLPMVVTDGDAMADWVKEEKLGKVVPQADPQAMAQAIESMLSNDGRLAYAPAFEKLRDRLRWKNVISPLLQFCLDPHLAPDKGLYVTDAERVAGVKDKTIAQIIHDKDAYIEQIIRDKDAYIEQIIHDKDNYTNQVIHDWEVFLEQTGRDWQAHLDRVVQDRDNHYQQQLQEKDRAYAQVAEQLEQAQAAYTTTRSQLEQTQAAYNTALIQLEKYRNLLPFRVYRAIKRSLGRQ